MQFLLVAVNAKYIHSNPAVYSLCGFVGKDWESYVSIAEYTINQSKDGILADIYKRKPSVIGFSCYIWNIQLIRELLTELPKLLPDVPIWLGGPEVSFNAEKYLEDFPCISGVMIGEGEETFRELLEVYITCGKLDMSYQGWDVNLREFDAALQGVLGLCLRSGRTGEREATDMNRLPFLYQDTALFENRIIYYESSRGCPYRCSYCLSSIDKMLRFRDIDTITKELQVFLDRKVKQVKFVDRTFNCKESHALAVLEYIKKHDNAVTNFHFEIAADVLTDAELAILQTMRPGLVQLEIGVQTINRETLSAINRKTDLERLATVVKQIRGFGNIHQHLDLIAGLPLEGYDSFARSFDFVYALQPQQLQLGFLKVLHGTVMEEKASSYGICYQDTPPYEVLYTKDLSYEEVCRLKRVAKMTELYYNSGQFVVTLQALAHDFSSPFAMFEALASFYEEQGYYVHQPSRNYRYDVLFDFIKQKVSQREAYYAECLMYDLYLRENLLTRPTFAKDLHPFRDEMRTLHQTGERKMTHVEPFFHRVWENTEVAPYVQAEEPIYVMFDYTHRNPLTGNAKVSHVNS